MIIALFARSSDAHAEDAGEATSKRGETAFEVGTGLEYQEGNYGTEDQVKTYSLPIEIAARSGRVRVGASTSYMRTTAPRDVIVSQGGLLGTPLLASNRTDRSIATREGFGDVTLQASYAMPVLGFAATVGAAVKVPTASFAKGLGTGKFDYGLSAQIARPLGRVTPFAAAGYTIHGAPDGYLVRNTASASVGTRINLGGATNAAISYSYEQSASQALADKQSVGLGLGTALTKSMHVSLEGDAGLTASAPDARLRLRLGIGF